VTPEERRLIDPAWHWMRDAIDRLHDEFSPGENLRAMTVLVSTDTGETVTYTVAPRTGRVGRRMVTGREALLRAAAKGTVSVSVEAGDLT
jgi:hypothetical protein